MKCFRYFSFALFALLGVFFGSFIISQNDTYAVEDKTITYQQGYHYSDWEHVFSDCYDACLSQYKYLKIETDSYPSTGSSEFISFYLRNSYSGSGNNWNFQIFYKTMPIIMSLNMPENYQSGVLDFYQGGTLKTTVTFTLMEDYQDLPAVPSGSLEITENGTYDVSQYAEAVVNVPETDCPPGAGGNYHEDLVAINNSIMICAATCLVIYFFYCIYRMIIKNSGVK